MEIESRQSYRGQLGGKGVTVLQTSRTLAAILVDVA